MLRATENVFVAPAGGLNLLLRALHCCGLRPVPAPTYRRYEMPRTLFGTNACLFATPAAFDKWLESYPAVVAITRHPTTGRPTAAWVDWGSEPSGLAAVLGEEGVLLRRMYATMAANFHLGTAVSAVGGMVKDALHRVEPDGSSVITHTLLLPGDDPTMPDEMKTPKTVLVTIDPKGGSKVEVVGGQGDTCLTATRQLIDALGVEASQDLKPEFYQQEAVATVDAGQS